MYERRWSKLGGMIHVADDEFSTAKGTIYRKPEFIISDVSLSW